jgi:cytoskeletal protein RodZ
MPSAGELIRSERVKRNRNLSEIACETCISRIYLEAIESDNPKILPGHFYHRSFLRQYAAALKLEELLTRQILDALEPLPEIDPMPALSLPLQIAHVEMQRKPLARVTTRGAAALLVLVLAGCSGLYAIWRHAEDKADLMEMAQPAVSEPAGIAPSAQPAPPEPAAATDTGSAANRFNVDLEATENTWVSISSAGRMVFSGVLGPSQTKNFALDDSARLLTGNAAGLDVRMNGRPLGPLGSRGQVRIVVFNQDNYRILSPHKM